eukprot:CAMPEP_0183792130 /NCGR_PEP_ID=MMETSP0803_2-20130417/2355_1 /TAXON_ID=195967 /ORGANISM="Crustomastix stigmata, Strain CCMP3273" /LENGTH=535 /DNA_ID=CAMNT_0026036473 /DNA_START=61 /DNA_END=1665 /DNA_ORIENTATION=-
MALEAANLVLSAVKAALAAKHGVVANKSRSARLCVRLEALNAPIDGLISSGKLTSDLHQKPLQRLLAAVQRASALLEKQKKKSYLAALASHAKTREDFDDVEREITSCMGDMQLSLAVDAGDPAADDARDLADMKAALRDIGDKQDGLAKQLKEVDDEQRASAQAVMEALQAGAARGDELMALLQQLVVGSEKQLAVRKASPLHEVNPVVDLRPTGVVLGQGAFGSVAREVWLKGGGLDVAVKTLSGGDLSNKALSELEKEARAMAALQHPNVVVLYGACLRPPRMCLVQELAPHGSLAHVLEASPGAMPWSERWSVGADMARGLLFLHNRNILHRDVKGANVLLFGAPPRRTGKLSDFGLAAVKSESSTLATRSTAGTPNWKAPELFSRRTAIASPASDMYSAACTLYEMAAGQPPWEGDDPGAFPMWVMQGERPDRPQGCPDDFWAAVEGGWAQSPDDRTTFDDLLAALEDGACAAAAREDAAQGAPGRRETEMEAEIARLRAQMQRMEAEAAASQAQAPSPNDSSDADEAAA